jgi:tetratricopeptide (TPR) repeat protein
MQLLTLCVQQILQPRPELIQWLRALADAFLFNPYERAGRIADLDETIALHREVLEQRPAPHPDRWILLDKLAFVLFNRFERAGQIENLDEAIALHRDVLEQRPTPHPDRWISLDKLAIVLSKTGRLADLDEAIALCREILEQRPATHLDRSSSLDSLSVAPLSRFGQTSQPHDVIGMHREALWLRPESDRWRSLDNLAFFLFMRFNQTHWLADQEEAFVLHCEALRLRENTNRSRTFLISDVPNPRQHFYKITHQEGEYIMDAGAVYGISIGDEFVVYQKVDSAMGTLVVRRVDEFSSMMVLSARDPLRVDLITPAFALQVKATGEYFRLHAAEDVMSTLNGEVSKMYGEWGVVFVNSIPEADISLQHDRVVLNTPLAIEFGSTCIPIRIDELDVKDIVRALTHYHRHLYRANPTGVLQKSVQIEFTKLKVVENGVDDDLFSLTEPDGPNLNERGVVNLVIDNEADSMCGIRIVNRSNRDLYPYLFWFDNDDMSISKSPLEEWMLVNLELPASFYEPARSYGRSEMVAPLRSKGSLTVGYGTGESEPFCYSLADGQATSVGFLKLFLTSTHVDLSDIPQLSPFLTHRGVSMKPLPIEYGWDAIVVAVVQRRRDHVF